jgi:hypothetical protein
MSAALPPAAGTARSGSAAWDAATSAPTSPTSPTWKPTSLISCATGNAWPRRSNADEWAITEAIPSDEEIRRVRRLITRVSEDLGDLGDEDKTQILDAVAGAVSGAGRE